MGLFRKDVPPLLQTYFRRPGKSVDGAFFLLRDVRDIMSELVKEPCVNQYFRERSPDLADRLPPAPSPRVDTSKRDCQELLAEYTVLEELAWALSSICEGNTIEIVRAYRERHDEKRPPWISDWGAEQAFL